MEVGKVANLNEASGETKTIYAGIAKGCPKRKELITIIVINKTLLF